MARAKRRRGKKGGQVPLKVLQKRLFKLNNIVKARGGQFFDKNKRFVME